MPHPIKIFFYKKILGYQIGKNVKIGWSYLDATNVEISDNVRIGHLNIIRGIKVFKLGKHSYIGNFNQFFGGRGKDIDWSSQLLIGEQVQIMSHHFMDVTGNILLDSNTTIAGRDSHFWSHSLVNSNDSPDGLERIEKNISIGENVYVGARVTLIGCQIPSKAIVGAGSVVNKKFASKSNKILIAGNPATIKKTYDSQPVSSSI